MSNLGDFVFNQGVKNGENAETSIAAATAIAIAAAIQSRFRGLRREEGFFSEEVPALPVREGGEEIRRAMAQILSQRLEHAVPRP
ncbi:MAG: hypothetical protein VKN33_05485 [Candidatus Sericytochromatia bacterium]|nr:hypothetical protein [Candidatus Sericytochromatia bacterium]